MPPQGRHYVSTHAIYQFKSQENKKIFDEAPEKYAPKYGGYCSIAIGEGSLFQANPKSALIQDGALYRL